MKSIHDSIIWIMMSTLSHIYIDWGLIIPQLEDVLIVVTLFMCFFISWDNRWYFLLWKTSCPIQRNDTTLLVYLIE